MTLHKSGEDYLEAILVLSREKGHVRSVDVADHFGYSRASVSSAVALLQKGGFLRVDPEKGLHLTDLGLDVAKDVYDRHCVLREMLQLLGISPETAAQDACEIEHVISAESFQRLKEILPALRERTRDQAARARRDRLDCPGPRP
ncbi:metal-dependent transcriptional regulator [Pseudoflavonifractor sp. MSJ-37]|uniref:metal-dependent transcriptional regulator n=1 Tax=Pseudoflavonifractor sp. MSJ-37 TaxID=2841531 RepID=UPI001C0FC8A2|nr:metal-dependent transcriptional regulator [Pseudoflavonifractor sp. MSJ-37]MBU5435477.1 metal-dependent transcriptional regulator [Pseudoflavonifractor sp. MSJ-37]